MRVENRMVVDSEWRRIEALNAMQDVDQALKEKGYHEMGTNTFVPEEEAFDYAFDRCMNGTEEEQKEFKVMLVEWFYSGNWVKED